MSLLEEIKRQAAGDVHLQQSLVAGAMCEGGSLEGPWPPGDADWSRGPFQIKHWRWDRTPLEWRGHPLTIEQAEDPATAVAYAIKYEAGVLPDGRSAMVGLGYRKNAALYTNPIDVAYHSEHPAHYYSQTQQDRAWAAIRQHFAGDEGGSVVSEPVIHWVGAHPSNFERGRGEISLEAVVWHVTEGGMPGPWFNDPRARASTNYAVSKTGRIEQYVALADTAYAHGSVEVAFENARTLIQANWGISPNLWAASIEFEGTTADVQAGRVPTPAQKAAAVHLTAWLFATELFDPSANARPLPSRETIGMHRDISPQSRTCPVWSEAVQAEMIAAVREKLQPPKPDPRPDPQPCPPMDATWLLRVGLARRAAEAALVLSAGEEPHTSAFNAARADALAIVETIDEAGRA